MNWNRIKRKTAGFLAAIMVMTNVAGDLPALGSLSTGQGAVTETVETATPSVPEKDTAAGSTTDSSTADNSIKETVSLEGTVVFLENDTFRIE